MIKTFEERFFPDEKAKYVWYINYLKFMLVLPLLAAICGAFIGVEPEKAGIWPDILFFIQLISYFAIGIFLFISIAFSKKTKILKPMIIIALGLIITFILDFIISTIWAAGDSLLAIGTMILTFIFGVIAAIIINRKRWHFVKTNLKYAKPIFVQILSTVVLFAIFSYFAYSEAQGHSRRDFLVVLIALVGIAFQVASGLGNIIGLGCLLSIVKEDYKKGIPFIDSWRKINLVPGIIYYNIFVWPSMFLNRFFNPGFFDNGGEDEFYSKFEKTDVDLDIKNSELKTHNIKNTKSKPSDGFDGPIFGNGIEVPEVTGIGTCCDVNTVQFADAKIDTAFDIPQFKENPYLLFTAYVNEGNVEFYDDEQNLKFKIEDNHCYVDENNKLVGLLDYDDAKNVIVFKDSAGKVIWTKDKQNNIYQGSLDGKFIGHIAKSGPIETIYDIKKGIFTYKDVLGQIYSGQGQAIGSIKTFNSLGGLENEEM